MTLIFSKMLRMQTATATQPQPNQLLLLYEITTKMFRVADALRGCFEQAESLNVLIAEGEQMLQKAADNFCNSAKTEQQRGLKT
ncbi:MAG TPA: hypothetical protein PK475_07105 [Rectinema sp.]|nr:hypothetical protein [Rectinema sp.]